MPSSVLRWASVASVPPAKLPASVCPLAPLNKAWAWPSAGTMILSPICRVEPAWAARVSPLRTICTPGLALARVAAAGWELAVAAGASSESEAWATMMDSAGEEARGALLAGWGMETVIALSSKKLGDSFVRPDVVSEDATCVPGFFTQGRKRKSHPSV